MKKLDYDSGEDIFDLKIGDYERWKVMKSDFPKVLRIINKKHNLNLIIKKKENQDLDWALK